MTEKTESLIDLVFTNILFNITMNDVYALSFRDHNLIGFKRKQNRVQTAPKTILCCNYHRYDHNKMKDDLENADWSPVYISHSIPDLLQTFNRIITEFFDRHTPVATKRSNINIFLWLTVELKSEMDYRDVLQRKFRKSKTTENYEKYKRQKKKVNNLIKRVKQNYNKNLLDENTKNATSFWRTLKSIFPTKPKSKLTSTTFKVQEEEISNKEAIPNGFGQFLSSIAKTLLLTLPPIKDFILNKSKNLPIRAMQKFSFHSVRPSEICKCLRKRRRKKAHGIDELPPNLP